MIRPKQDVYKRQVPAREDIEAKKQIILRHGLALWDTLERLSLIHISGVPAGPGIRKVLEALLDGVIREEYPNERQALLIAVQQLAAS